jgi:transcriptional regulator with XRE-family HTH domain
VNIGYNLKKIRKDKGLTQDKLSEITKISIASIQRYELGKRQPNIQTVNKFAEALGVTINTLLKDENISLGENIKKLRKNKGLSQKQLAEILNLSEITIRRYEKCSNIPTIETLDKIAIALDVPLNELLGTNATTNDIEKKIGTSLNEGDKKKAANNFNELAEILDWNDFKNINEDDIFEVIKSKEFYNYLKFLFFERIRG